MNSTLYLVLILIILLLTINYLSTNKNILEEQTYNILKDNYKNSEELLLELFYIRKNLYLKILTSNNNISSEEDYDNSSYIEILNGVELLLVTIQKSYKENNFEYIINKVANMVDNLFYNNKIVISAIKNNKFLISFDKEIKNIKGENI
jgi:hypothetical protein